MAYGQHGKAPRPNWPVEQQLVETKAEHAKATLEPKKALALPLSGDFLSMIAILAQEATHSNAQVRCSKTDATNTHSTTVCCVCVYKYA